MKQAPRCLACHCKCDTNFFCNLILIINVHRIIEINWFNDLFSLNFSKIKEKKNIKSLLKICCSLQFVYFANLNIQLKMCEKNCIIVGKIFFFFYKIPNFVKASSSNYSYTISLSLINFFCLNWKLKNVSWSFSWNVLSNFKLLPKKKINFFFLYSILEHFFWKYQN